MSRDVAFEMLKEYADNGNTDAMFFMIKINHEKDKYVKKILDLVKIAKEEDDDVVAVRLLQKLYKECPNDGKNDEGDFVKLIKEAIG